MNDTAGKNPQELVGPTMVIEKVTTTTDTTTDFEGSGDTLENMGTAPPPSRGDYNVQRRSQRVMLKVSVVVLAHGADNKVVSEATRTVTVNAQGASVMLSLKVSVRQILILRNSGTGEEVSSGVSQPSSIRKARSRSRFYEALPRILAHFLSST
jgi:hypothetical protein